MAKLISVGDFEKAAISKLPPSLYGSYFSGSSNERTYSENSKAFQRWYIRPRVLQGKSSRNTKKNFLGTPISAPIGIAPTAFHMSMHPQAEKDTARGASAVGMPFVVSLHTSTSIEDISNSAPNGIRLMQVSTFKDKNLIENVIRRAEKSGVKGIVLTVDSPHSGIRYDILRWKDEITKNYTFEQTMLNESQVKKASISPTDARVLFEPGATWEYVKWIKSVTKLPLIVKGILTAEDALFALDAGVEAIWVSNHGGRKLDGSMPTLEALPDIVKVVNKRCPVYIDGGFRSGSDVFIAMALGADMVFLGRPIMWALSAEGKDGVQKVLSLLKDELEAALTFTGCSDLSSIRREMIVRVSSYDN